MLLAWLSSPRSWSLQPQQPSSNPAQQGTTDTAAASSTLLISARTKDGSPLELLTSDLEIKADGKPATVQEVHRVSGAPLRYCILFDSSGSERSRFQLQKDEATGILSKVVQAGRDHGMLVAFNTRFFVDADSANPQDLVKALAKSDPRGGTALYDAAVASAKRLSMSISKSDPDPVLRVMFILSDGEDTSSRLTRDAAVQAVLKTGVRIYAIGQKNGDPNSPRSGARGVGALREFAQRTGGTAYFPGKEQDAAKAVADIAEELSNLFLVTYSPSQQHQDGRLHKLEVKGNRKGVSIAAPDHYNAPQS